MEDVSSPSAASPIGVPVKIEHKSELELVYSILTDNIKFYMQHFMQVKHTFKEKESAC